MNLRHAAALAVVGWYLLAPPLAGKEVHNEWPLSSWTLLDSYDTAAECRAELEANQARMMQGMKNQKLSSHDYDVGLRFAYGEQCIASDDPRLAGGLSSEHGRPPGGSR
jgi:hypothetical protein